MCIVLRSATRSRTCEADFCVSASVGMRVGVGSGTGGGGDSRMEWMRTLSAFSRASSIKS